MKDFFEFQILTKPYIAKYLHTVYGTPVVFDENDYFGTTLLGYLTKKMYRLKEKEVVHRKLDVFNTPVKIFLPSYWLRNHKYKTDIDKTNLIYLNKHLEQHFEQKLNWHCYVLSLIEVEYQDALEDFCRRYKIEMDVDITFDCIKQKEYRERMKLEARLNRTDLSRYIQPRFF